MKTILVVEDTADAREMIKFLLEMLGYTVIEAADGREGIEIITADTPDLILMDISMPVMDGLTAAKEIRCFEEAKAVPIIAMTAFGQDYHQKAIEAGCNALITKPIDFDKLEKTIDEYLSPF